MRAGAGIAAALCVAVGVGAGTAARADGPTSIFADGFESGDGCGWRAGTSICPGFEVAPPPMQIAGGEEAVRCYYFRTGSASLLGVRRIVSSMHPLALYVALFTTYDGQGQPVELQPPGTLAPCLWGAGDAFSRRIYLAHEEQEQLVLPADDGAGSPLGLEFLADQPAVLVMHFLNLGVDPVTVSASLSAHALPVGAAFTRTATLSTYATDILVGSGSTGASTHACPVPQSVKFWWFSTHTHGFATLAEVRNGASPLVSTTDWESPAVAVFGPPSFYEFGVGDELTYDCDYFNPLGQPVISGDSYVTDEYCSAFAYFFPASEPRNCVNDVLLP
jgi:hypothetical protein